MRIYKILHNKKVVVRVIRGGTMVWGTLMPLGRAAVGGMLRFAAAVKGIAAKSATGRLAGRLRHGGKPAAAAIGRCACGAAAGIRSAASAVVNAAAAGRLAARSKLEHMIHGTAAQGSAARWLDRTRFRLFGRITGSQAPVRRVERTKLWHRVRAYTGHTRAAQRLERMQSRIKSVLSRGHSVPAGRVGRVRLMDRIRAFAGNSGLVRWLDRAALRERVHAYGGHSRLASWLDRIRCRAQGAISGFQAPADWVNKSAMRKKTRAYAGRTVTGDGMASAHGSLRTTEKTGDAVSTSAMANIQRGNRLLGLMLAAGLEIRGIAKKMCTVVLTAPDTILPACMRVAAMATGQSRCRMDLGGDPASASIGAGSIAAVSMSLASETWDDPALSDGTLRITQVYYAKQDGNTIKII